MVAIDTNILVYSHRLDNPWHSEAKQFISGLANSSEPFAIPYHCLIEYTAIVTNPRIFREPTPTTEALDQCENLLKAGQVVVLTDTPESLATFRVTALESKARGAMVHDARIIAICLENAVKTLYSADRDFGRFTGIRIVNPLVKRPGV